MRNRLLLRIGVTLAVSLIHVGGIHPESQADEPWVEAPLTADPRSVLATAKSVAADMQKIAKANSDIALLYDADRVEFFVDGRIERMTHTVMRYSPSAVLRETPSVARAWSPSYQARPELQVRIIAPDGATLSIDPKTIETVNLGATEGEGYGDVKAIRAPLPGVQPGAVVEVVCRFKDTKPFFAGGRLVSYTLDLGEHIARRRIQIAAPAQSSVKVAMEGTSMKPKTTTSGGNKFWTLDFKPIEHKPAHFEQYSPGDIPWPTLRASHGATWADIARGYHAAVKSKIKANPVVNLAKQIVGDTKDRNLIVRKLTQAVRERVRYTGIWFGNGTIIPREPSETLTRRFGDCKDQSVLLVSLLEAAGIPAKLALIHASGKVDPEFPALNAFNHMVVVVPAKEGAADQSDIWIDPTATFSRPGQLPQSLEGQRALVVDADTTKLTVTPITPADQNRAIVRVDFRLGRLSDGRVTERGEYHGHMEAALRSAYASLSSEARIARLKQTGFAIYQGTTGTVDKFTEPSNFSTPLILQFTTTDSAFGQFDGASGRVHFSTEIAFNDLPFILLSRPVAAPNSEFGDTAPLLEKVLKSRRHPVRILPHSRQMHFRIRLPNGFAVADLPESTEWKHGPVEFKQAISRESDRVINAVISINVESNELSPNDAAEVWREIHKYRESTTTGHAGFVLSLEHMAGQHRQRREYLKAIATYRELLKANPGSVKDRFDYIDCLLEAGLVSAANSEAKKMLDDHPQHHLSHAVMGHVHARNAVGVQFGRGMNAEAAEASFRKSLELKEDLEVRYQLAHLLARDTDGWWLSDPSRTAKAVEEYRKVWNVAKTSNVAASLGWALLAQNKAEEISQIVNPVSTTEATVTLGLTATALSKGVDATVDLVNRSQLSRQEGARLLLLAGDQLVTFRHYQKGRDLHRAALPMLPNESQQRVEEVMEFQEDLKRYSPAKDFKKPEDVARRFVALGYEDRSLSKEAFALFANPKSKTTRSNLEYLKRRVAADSQMMAQVSRQRRADEVSRMTIERRDDGADGVWLQLDLRPVFVDMFLARNEKHEWKIVDVWSDPGFGHHVLKLLDDEHVDAATTWMNWAYQMSGNRRPALFNSMDGRPFVRLWAYSDKSKVESIRLAAQALAMTSHPDDVGDVLKAVDKLRPTLQPHAKLQVNRAMAAGFMRAKKHEEAVECLDRIRKSHPTAAEPLMMWVLAMTELGRTEEALAEVKKHLKSKPNDPRLNAHAAFLNSRLGRFNQALEHLNASREADRFRRRLLQEAAGQPDQDADEFEKVTGRRLEVDTNRLVVVLAQAGKVDFNQVRNQFMQGWTIQSQPFTPADHVAYGRLNELVNLPETARSHYAIAIQKAETLDSTVKAIAQRRLSRLNEVKSTP